MAQRKYITLIYRYDENWIGGMYYMINIIKALNLLKDDLKPFLTIVYDNAESTNAIREINYPYIDYKQSVLKFNLFQKIVNKIFWILLNTAFYKLKINDGIIENLYPVSLYTDTSNVNKFYYWIPDFQEHHLPGFFSKNEIKNRVKTQVYIKSTKRPIVFSSNNALNDYNYFYPDNENRKEVLNFVSIIDPDYKLTSMDGLREKYYIKKPYFIVPNQFWQHKNQAVVAKAAKLLRNSDLDFQIIFTGKEYDHRNPDYVPGIKNFVTDNQLQDTVTFLGFIDRNEQLQLMKNAVAIIQPSLFEGWSTVVEDSKEIGNFIILSDIPLHREQISKNCVFFDPYSPENLAEKMTSFLVQKKDFEPIDYQKAKMNFALKFLEIF